MHSKDINKTKNISKMKAIHCFHKCMVGGALVQAHKEVECSPIFHSQPSLHQKAASVLSQWCCNWPELPTSLSTDLQTKHSCITYNTVSNQTFGKSVYEPLFGTKANSASPFCMNRKCHSPSSLSLHNTNASLKTQLDMTNPHLYWYQLQKRHTITLQFNQSTAKKKTLLP